jgi:hypothetical protein
MFKYKFIHLINKYNSYQLCNIIQDTQLSSHLYLTHINAPF